MPYDDDFDFDFENDDVEPETASPADEGEVELSEVQRLEIDLARARERQGQAPKPNRAERRKKQRKKAAAPDGAPAPQDHLPKKDARADEVANGTTLVLTLWDKTIQIDQATLLESWDFQLGTVQGNPLLMVKGLLGDRDFAWFATRSRAEGKSPIEAASEVMTMFARATGFDSAGK